MTEPDGTPPTWEDDHSVTCVFCGYLADERETYSITDDLGILGEGMPVGSPLRYGAIIAAVNDHGRGEAHSTCWTNHFHDYINDRAEVIRGRLGLLDDPLFTIDGQFTDEGLSVTAYSMPKPTVVDESWFTYDEIELLAEQDGSDFTFELGGGA